MKTPMNATQLEYKIVRLERELHELKAMLTHTRRNKKGKKGGFSSLRGFLSPKHDLSLKQIQAFKYKPKGM